MSSNFKSYKYNEWAVNCPFIFIFLFLFSIRLFSQISVNNGTIPCYSDQSIATLTISSGTPPYSIFYSDCASTGSLSTNNSTPSFTLGCTTTFTVKDAGNSIIGITTSSVTFPSSFTMSILMGVMDTICNGNSVSLTGNEALPASPGLTYTIYPYNWSTGGPATKTIVVSPTYSKAYSFSAYFINSKGRTCNAKGNDKTVFVRLCGNPNTSGIVNSSCLAAESIKKKYEKDAARLALRYLNRTKDKYNDSIRIFEVQYKRYLNALLAVYNATNLPASDTVCRLLQYPVHTNPTYEGLNTITVFADSNLTWMQNLKNNIIPTGNISVDKLMNKFNLQKTAYNNLNQQFYYQSVSLKTDTNLNISALSKVFLQLNGVYSTSDDLSYTDGPDIRDSTTSDPRFTELDYSFAWGDCLLGCTGRRTWKFRVFNDCTVQYISSEGAPLPPSWINSVKEVGKESDQILIYPNPTSYNLDLNFSDISEITNYKLQITNSLGKVVKEIRDTELKIEDKRLRIVVSDLPEGFYVLRLKTKDDLLINKNFLILR